MGGRCRSIVRRQSCHPAKSTHKVAVGAPSFPMCLTSESQVKIRVQSPPFVLNSCDAFIVASFKISFSVVIEVYFVWWIQFEFLLLLFWSFSYFSLISTSPSLMGYFFIG